MNRGKPRVIVGNQDPHDSALRPVSDYRVNQTKWVVLRWPPPALAQLAGMSTAAFEDFYFAVCTLDYRRMAKAEEALKQRMEETDRVCILGPGESLEFSSRLVSPPADANDVMVRFFNANDAMAGMK